MNKKGLDVTAESLKMFVAAIILLVLLLFIAEEFFKTGDDLSEVEKCRISVKQNAYSRAAGLD